MAEIQLPIEIDMAMPGETLDITIELIQPIKITEEEPFIIRDDECTVGLGRVGRIIDAWFSMYKYIKVCDYSEIR